MLGVFPVPTTMASGIARLMAQRQDITNTEIAMVSANRMSRPAASHPRHTAMAIMITVGTKTAATRSAMSATGAFVP